MPVSSASLNEGEHMIEWGYSAYSNALCDENEGRIRDRKSLYDLSISLAAMTFLRELVGTGVENASNV